MGKAGEILRPVAGQSGRMQLSACGRPSLRQGETCLGPAPGSHQQNVNPPRLEFARGILSGWSDPRKLLMKAVMINERARASERRRAFLRGGTISHSGKTVPCVVRALSSNAARLLVYVPDRLPDCFRLYIEINCIEVDCHVDWRRGKEIGVSFEAQDHVAHAVGTGRELIGPAAVPALLTESGASIRGGRNQERARFPMLIAEDDPDDRLMLRDAFHDSGVPCKLDFVSDGQELLEYLGSLAPSGSRATPALILLDLNMPRMDGRTALLHIKQSPELRRIPVVVFTTSNADEDVQRTYDLGISSYIPKPSSYEGLMDVVWMLNQYWGNRVRLPK